MLHDDDHGLAAHEAGHAIAFCRLRIPFWTVELLHDDPLGRGGAVFGPSVDLAGGRDRFLAALLAGALSESAFTGRTLSDIAATCGHLDFQLIAELTEDMAPRELQAHARRAERLVARNSWLISLVAVALLEHRALAEADVHAIIREGGRRDDSVAA